MKPPQDVHHTDNPSHKKRWDNALQRMDKMFESYVDPFDTSRPPKQLVNIATGAVATREVEKSMVSYITKGQETATKFISERLVRENTDTEPEKSFYYPLARSGMHINESH